MHREVVLYLAYFLLFSVKYILWLAIWCILRYLKTKKMMKPYNATITQINEMFGLTVTSDECMQRQDAYVIHT